MAENSKTVSKSKYIRSDNFSFERCGIPIGAKLELLHHPEYTAIVKDDCSVVYEGKVYVLSYLAKILLGVSYPVSGTRYWTYKGKTIKNIRHEREKEGLY